jgi:hypothetical protein
MAPDVNQMRCEQDIEDAGSLRGGLVKKRKQNNKRARRAAASNALSPHRDVCFVIMPFGGWLDDYYETIYQPAIEASGLAPHRADDLYRPSTIINDIWAYTRRAKLLVADLTGKNPNVFYELGLAHALAKPVILVAESMDDIPFDLRALRVIVYEKNDPQWGALLKAKIEASIKEVLGAPQEAVLPAFLHVRESNTTPKVTAREKDLIEIKQEMDLLRREVRRRDIDRPYRQSTPIDPVTAEASIESYLKLGLGAGEIVKRLEGLGPPERWIRHKIFLLKRRAARTSKKTRPVINASTTLADIEDASPKV